MRDERSGIGTGIVLIAVGLLFMADRQGIVNFRQLWPAILIVMGLVTMLFPNDARRGRRGRAGGGMWLVLVGSLLLANQNHWLMFRDSWPLFIVAGGLALIFGSAGRRNCVNQTSDQSGTTGTTGTTGTDTSGGGSWR